MRKREFVSLDELARMYECSSHLVESLTRQGLLPITDRHVRVRDLNRQLRAVDRLALAGVVLPIAKAPA